MCTSDPAEEVTGSHVVGSCQAHLSVLVPAVLPEASPPQAVSPIATPAPMVRPRSERRLIEVAAVLRTALRRWWALPGRSGVVVISDGLSRFWTRDGERYDMRMSGITRWVGGGAGRSVGPSGS